MRKLDASLVLNGVEVFLDERDIKVGESIPARIYDGISKASHIIYVLSNSSVYSSWVNEELDIAKMKQKKDEGFGILPVLIEDIEIPMYEIPAITGREQTNPGASPRPSGLA